MTPAPHPDIAPLEPLLGAWQGEGRGEYPTIEPFGYVETIELTHVGKPFVAYGQRTRATDDGRPLHAETGYWRVPAPGRIELVLAHPTGVVEVDEGTYVTVGGGFDIELASTLIGRTGTAKLVTDVRRSFHLRNDELTYEVAMAAVGRPLQHHLAATLQRRG